MTARSRYFASISQRKEKSCRKERMARVTMEQIADIAYDIAYVR